MYEYMTLAFAGLNEQGESLYYYDPNLIQEGGQMTTSKPGTVKSMDYVTTNSGEASRIFADRLCLRYMVVSAQQYA